MRLIDADRLFYNLERGVRNASNQVFREIANTPTEKAIPVEQLLSILSNSYDEIMEDDDYSQGFEDGWNACLKAIKEELNYWEKESERDV